MVSFPYYSHTTPIRIPKDMGIVWEAYHKQVPLLGVPENPIDYKGIWKDSLTFHHHVKDDKPAVWLLSFAPTKP